MRTYLLLLLQLLCFSAGIAQNGAGMYFQPNEGQWNEPIVAKCIFKGGAIFLRKDGFRVKLINKADLPNIHKAFHHRNTDSQFAVRGAAIDVLFNGCNTQEMVEISREDEAPYYENYYLGDDDAKWITGLYPVRKIRLKNVYSNIDFVIYTKGEEVEFDWVIHPGGQTDKISFTFTGQDSIKLINGNIFCHTSAGDFVVQKPHAVQNEKSIVSAFVGGNTVGEYRFGPMNYDHSRILVIDPVLVFSTYSGSRGDNFGFTATYDSTGHLYAGGIMDIDQGTYPVTTGAFQTIYGGSGPAQAPVFLPCDVSISKYAPDGKSLVYATYLGGRSNEYAHSLSIDEKNNLLVFGTTLSNNFPVLKNIAVDSSYNGQHDLYVVKLSADGKNMLGGTYFGGTSNDGINTGELHFNYADDFRGDILADTAGNIYVASCTRSTNFPVAHALQSTLRGSQDAVVFSLNSNLSKLRWSTFLGGVQDDAAYSVKMDDSNRLFIGGGTASRNFTMAAGGVQPTYGGGPADGFIYKLRADSGKAITSTFWGTAAYDQIYFLDYDPQQKIYFNGQTEGNINRTAGTYGKNGTTQFIGKLSNDLKVTEVITTFGNRTGTPELSPCAFMVDKCYNIYFSGWGSSVGAGNEGTSAGLEISSNAYQKTTDDNDFYLLVLSRDAQSLLYATYFGGNMSEDHVDGGTSRFDKRGVIYQSVCASCPESPPGLNDFPTTAGAAFPNNVSYRCSNASFKFDFNITYAVEARFTAFPMKVCLPKPIQFTLLTPGIRSSYLWSFGDGTTSTVANPSHLYLNPGKYKVKLRLIDTASCNKADSMELEVEVLAGPSGQLKIDTEPCSTLVKMEVDGKDFDTNEWDLGDGKTSTDKKLEHEYNPGKYDLKVILINTASGCRDTLKSTLNINADSLEDIRLANIFTPNFDGKNDCFKVIGLGKDCNPATLKIFNRWGERIFETDDMNECWEGRVDNGNLPLPEGTYFYQIIVKGRDGKKGRVIAGSVNLIR